MSSSSFLVALGFCLYSILSFANSFNSSFLIQILFLLSLLWLVFPIPMLNKNSESGHPCFDLDIGGNAFSFSPLDMMLAVDLYMVFLMFAYVPLIRTLLRVFLSQMLNFVTSFSASVEMIISFLFFSLSLWCIILFGLWILKHSYVPGANPT